VREASTLIVPILMSARSGSSVTAHAVQVLGVDLGPALRVPKAKNPLGFFEDRDVLQLSRRLRDALGCRARMSRPAADSWDSEAVRHLEDEAVALLRGRFGSSALWGFKNGRILRFLPFWQRVLSRLDGEVRYVLATRNPLAAALSRERGRRAKLTPNRGGVELNLFEWLTEVLPWFDRLATAPLLVVDFDRITGEPLPQLQRIASFLDLDWSPERDQAAAGFAQRFVADGLRHHRCSLDELMQDPRVPGLVRDSYRWLDALAGDTRPASDPALWADWPRLNQQLAQFGPLLDAAGDTEQALWQAQLDPLSPLKLLGRGLRGRLRG